MNAELTRCLDDLEARLDLEQEARHREAWQRFLDDDLADGYFTPPARRPAPPRTDWPAVHINDALADPDLMLLSQFGQVSQQLAAGSGAALGVRCNYGVPIIASQYGCEVITMSRQQANLPTASALPDPDAVRSAVDHGIPDPRAGLGGKVFDTAERFLEAMQGYPKVSHAVSLYHPDLQGPIDNVELIWGSSMFLAFYDTPELMRAFLQLVTEHYIRFLSAWRQLVPQPGPYAVHWNLWMRGYLMLRNDSLMNLSNDVYVDFIRDCDQRLLDAFGGAGAIHFCGRGDHFIAAMAELRGLTAINMSQPELNDMDRIYQHTVDRGILLLGLRRAAAEAAGRDLHGRVHC